MNPDGSALPSWRNLGKRIEELHHLNEFRGLDGKNKRTLRFALADYTAILERARNEKDYVGHLKSQEELDIVALRRVQFLVDEWLDAVKAQEE